MKIDQSKEIKVKLRRNQIDNSFNIIRLPGSSRVFETFYNIADTNLNTNYRSPNDTLLQIKFSISPIQAYFVRRAPSYI